MKRRRFLAGAVSLLLPGAAMAHGSLGAKARANGLLFGCAASSGQLSSDLALRKTIAKHADILVHEYEMKRALLQPRPNVLKFEHPEKLMQFAAVNGKLVRGHTLVWYKGNPPWLEEALEAASSAGKEKLLVDYIREVTSHFRGRLHSWDVVNEPVAPEERRGDGMRADNLWYRAFGETYIELAFAAAKESVPSTPLYLNEYGVESLGRNDEARRTALLDLLDRLLLKNVPVEGLGIQGHLWPYIRRFDPKRYEAFLRSLEGYGLKLMITELDVSDRGSNAAPEVRDADIAAVTRDFLAVSLESRSMTGVLSWGLGDRHSWHSTDPVQRREDGQTSRVLPFDDEMRPKPMWHAIADAFDAAPTR